MFFTKLGHFKRVKVKKPPGIILSLVAILLLSAFLSDGYAQISDILSPKNMEVQINSLSHTNSDINMSSVQWDILDKLQEKDNELAEVPISMGPREIVYYENRISILAYDTNGECKKRKNGIWDDEYKICKSTIRKRLSDKERGIGLKLLDTVTGEIKIIKINTKITTHGVEIISPDGYQIEIVERANGIRWNLWNTLYQVTAPKNTVVIKNNYPREETVTVSKTIKGKVRKEIKKVVKGFLYVPHSNYLEQDNQKKVLTVVGRDHDKNIVAQAFADLRQLGVKSKVFPNKLVVDVEALSPRFFERLPLLEQGDFTEFQLDPQKTIERVLIILGANGENAWRYTCNRSDACGWVQFTPRTYKNIRTIYPAAKLMANFKEGAGNQLNSITAAILLHDYNLANLVKRYGEKILDDPRLEEFLAASYNGSPTHVHRSLDATLSKTVLDWTKHLKRETHGFMFKLRYLAANDLP